jgi:crossover junction endodeoxyribonuclease RusA
MSQFTFFVPGIPAPKGSTKAFLNKWTGRVIVTADNREPQKAWQSTVSAQASEVVPSPLAGGVEVKMVFILPRPKSLPKKIKEHLKKPDIDKLARTVLDGLTGIAFADDSEVVGMEVIKRYRQTDEKTGCWLTVYNT